MKKRQRKKFKKIIYEELIEDVTLEISLNSKWRRKIFKLLPNEVLEITYLNPMEIPEYIKKEIVQNKLEFLVMKVQKCEEKFDDELEIFKFQSKEYPQIIRFSANNPNI